jgi:hypothetical protein
MLGGALEDSRCWAGAWGAAVSAPSALGGEAFL